MSAKGAPARQSRSTADNRHLCAEALENVWANIYCTDLYNTSLWQSASAGLAIPEMGTGKESRTARLYSYLSHVWHPWHCCTVPCTKRNSMAKLQAAVWKVNGNRLAQLWRRSSLHHCSRFWGFWVAFSNPPRSYNQYQVCQLGWLWKHCSADNREFESLTRSPEGLTHTKELFRCGARNHKILPAL